MKLFTKVMANRLRPAIAAIVDAEQTSFIHGRSIAENFVYAADLLSCCHKRNLPTAVLKLDFKKAFNSVEWSSLDAILMARGFDQRWRGWISAVLSTGKMGRQRLCLTGCLAAGLLAVGGFGKVIPSPLISSSSLPMSSNAYSSRLRAVVI